MEFMRRTVRALLCVVLLLGVFCGMRATAGETICVEAEAARDVVAPMQMTKATDTLIRKGTAIAGASGKSYLEVPQGKGNPPKVTTGVATVDFAVKQSRAFLLWCRVWWIDECGNSLTVVLDDGRPFVFGQDGTYKTWHWVRAPVRLKQLNLDAGKHTLKVLNREDGVRIDQILLTTDKRYVPVGVEEGAPPKAAAKDKP